MNDRKVPAYEIVYVTPTLARQWLRSNAQNNRKVRADTVRAYADDMKKGLWRFTPSPVVFDSRGVLIDGQHRLLAVIESGVIVRMAVCRGVPTNSMDAIDRGLQRTFSDIARMHGKDWATDKVCATARMLIKTDPRRFWAVKKASATRVIMKAEDHRQAIEFAIENTGNRRGITGAPLWCAITRFYYHVELDMLSDFCAAIAGRASSSERDVIAFNLGTKLATLTAGGDRCLREKFLRSVWALRRYCDHSLNGNALRAPIRMANPEMVPPLPEEMG